MKIEFVLVEHASEAWRDAVVLRENILRKPFDCFFSEDELAEESNHYHVAGYLDGMLVATAVLVPTGSDLKMQRVAVLEAHRNKNIGSEMMAFCETFAHNKHFKNMYCHARDSAVKFYLKNGYLGEGDYFVEDGIPHLKMTKLIENTVS